MAKKSKKSKKAPKKKAPKKRTLKVAKKAAKKTPKKTLRKASKKKTPKVVARPKVIQRKPKQLKSGVARNQQSLERPAASSFTEQSKQFGYQSIQRPESVVEDFEETEFQATAGGATPPSHEELLESEEEDTADETFEETDSLFEDDETLESDDEES